MNNIPLLGQIAAFLSFIGFGGIVGLLIGRWLTRGRPSVTLVGIESGIGVSPVAKSRVVNVPESTVELSRSFFWTDPIYDLITLNDLYKTLTTIQQFYKDSDKPIRKAETLFRTLSKSNISIEEKVRVTVQLIDDNVIQGTIVVGLRRGELVLPEVSSGDAILLVEMQDNEDGSQTALIEDPDHNRHVVGYPTRVLAFEKERLDLFVEIVKSCDTAGLRQALSFAKNNLREQRDLAEQLIAAIQPLVQSTYWQLEVMVANRGDRIVLLSPYAVLTTKGGRRRFRPLPLTVFSTTSKPEGANEGHDMEWDGGPESHSGRYLVLKPQSAEQITFLSDVEVGDVGDYAELRKVYDADVLSCSIVLKRENMGGWRGNATALRSPWISFGGRFADYLRQEVAALAGVDSFPSRR